MTDPKASLAGWCATAVGLPPRGQPVLCAWNGGAGWLYFVAKWTGKRWLEVIPDVANHEYTRPDYWREIEAPT